MKRLADIKVYGSTALLLIGVLAGFCLGIAAAHCGWWVE